MSWRDRAACIGRAVLFIGPTNEQPGPRANREALAKQICAGCPVRQECLADGQDDAWWIRGGLTPEERNNHRPECGTLTGSHLHYRNGETPCPACRQAKTDYMADWRKAHPDLYRAAAARQAATNRTRRHAVEVK